MLILTRKQGQAVEVRSPDGQVVFTVKILSVRGKRVRVGVTAPQDHAIRRDDMVVEEKLTD